jgi:hypothetical protein
VKAVRINEEFTSGLLGQKPDPEEPRLGSVLDGLLPIALRLLTPPSLVNSEGGKPAPPPPGFVIVTLAGKL